MPKFINAFLIVLLLYGCVAEDDETLLYKNPSKVIESAITNPDVPDTIPQIKAEIQVKRAIDFRNSLPPDLLEWTVQNPNSYSIIINEFIADYTPRNEFIAYNMIWSMAYNDHYSEDLFIADNDELNAAYSGPAIFIPNSINTDVNLVTVDFESTYSDGENAEKMVSLILVEALESALKKANSVLTTKISSIEIKSTTNGLHAVTSNHYNKTALDITKINGQKIVDIRWDSAVYELQKAFDQSSKIRENFGPSLKHKTYIDGSRDNNYKIPGCFDHIHISVQSY